MKTIFSILVISLALSSVSGFSQELPKPEKFQNVRWYQMVMIKYKTDKAPEAKAMIKKYFVPVEKEIGRNVISFDMPFGEYDEIAYFPITSLDELNYTIPPSGMKWMQTFIRQQGQENATKLLKQFEELIERTTTALVRQSD